VGRSVAVHVMAEGAAKALEAMVGENQVVAVVCLGGSNAATIFSKITEVVPTGIPKILMSTVISGDTRPIINASDAILLYPIVDIEGTNSILDAVIDRLAAVSVGATRAARMSATSNSTRSVGMTMFGVTTMCVTQVRNLLEADGLEVFALHANGSGGKSLERFIEEGFVSSVIDITTTEIADELFNGMFPAGPTRLTAASRFGVPQVISTGALDMINFGPLHTVPEDYRQRNLLPHNDLVTLLRTTPAENKIMGQAIAQRIGIPSAPTAVVVPLQGFSEIDKPGSPFYNPDATAAFLDGLKSSVARVVEVIEVDLHINSLEFAEIIAQKALEGRELAGLALAANSR
jgi:uncharacterized protein (UPF0261 family)